MQIKKITVNDLVQPIGISGEDIRFSWQLESDQRGVKQKRFDLQIALDANFRHVIWHHNEWGDQSTNIAYQGPNLVSKTRYYVRVKCWDFFGNETDWMHTNFETGLLKAIDWQANWVTSANPQVKVGVIKPFTGYHRFELKKEVANARLYISAMGIYMATLNNQKIGEDYFTPGWTDYNQRIQYQVYDITTQLATLNHFEVHVAEGWFTGYLGWEKQKNTYGNFNAFIAQIEIEYTDGEIEQIASDDSWQERSNQWEAADLYNGEQQIVCPQPEIIGKLEQIDVSKESLVAQENEPVRMQEELSPIDLFKDATGRLILDMGQNMVGWVRFRIKGEAGSKISLTHGEILDREGNFYRNNIREAQQKDTYVLDGSEQVLEPNFTFHGFRYVHLENFPDSITKEDFKGIVLHSDMQRTGHFTTSDPLLNQLHHNILWGQKGNFLDVPTDCPQRDERLGWTADAQIFFPTASFNMKTYNFFKKWLTDLRYNQSKNGSVPFVVPDVLKGVFADNAARTTAAWGDAATIVPWEMYQRYGDTHILEVSYTSMKQWVDYIRGQGTVEELWDTGLQLGDWLALDAEEGSFFGATDETLVASSYFAYSTAILAQTARVLGKYSDYQTYQALHEKIKATIAKNYFSNGRLSSDTQTAHILVLLFELYPENSHSGLVQRLVELIEAKGGHLDTGFIGSPYICRVLAENGHMELAYNLLFNRELPSWLYQVEKGATTVWEHWDGIKSDGTFWDDGMNSFNHYAYGSIGIWMYETIGGIKVKTPGYQQAILAPKLDNRLTYCETSLETLYGRLSCHWQRQAEQLSLTVTIPANCEAEVVLPQVADKEALLAELKEQWQPKRVGSKVTPTITDIGIAKFAEHEQACQVTQVNNQELLVFLGSGTYQITYQLKK